MKIASKEIRGLVVKAYASGTATRKQLAEIFGYTTASIGNWINEYEREQRIEPLPRGHRVSVFSQEELGQLAELLEKNVDMTLAEIKDYFHKECSVAAIHKIVEKLGFVFKKNTEGKRTRARGYHPESEKLARISSNNRSSPINFS
jgi:transposase